VNRLRVAAIVEGHGDEKAVPLLLRRIWTELLGGEYIDVIRPIRHPRARLVQKGELEKAVQLAALKLSGSNPCSDAGLVLILIDANSDAPCMLGPRLLDCAKAAAPHVDIACVLANVEYETWFVAAAQSLCGHLSLAPEESLPEDPESSRLKKAWIEKRYKGVKYSETIDQPAMTADMDLSLCRRRSPSFDKLCRELEKRFRM